MPLGLAVCACTSHAIRTNSLLVKDAVRRYERRAALDMAVRRILRFGPGQLSLVGLEHLLRDVASGMLERDLELAALDGKESTGALLRCYLKVSSQAIAADDVCAVRNCQSLGYCVVPHADGAGALGAGDGTGKDVSKVRGDAAAVAHRQIKLVVR